MSVYEEAPESNTDSFWEIGQFKRAVRRCDDGFDLCSKLSQLVQERAEIEKSYSSHLQRWSQKWHHFLEKGPEYGTMKCAWEGVTQEAASLSVVHSRIRDDLITKLQTSVKNWQKENYQKTTLPPQKLKNSKDFEDRFHRAQKAWARQYRVVAEAKKAYHSACKQDRSLKLQLQNAKNDPSAQADQAGCMSKFMQPLRLSSANHATPEAEAEAQVRKLEEKVKRADREVDRTETAYKNSVTDVDGMNPGYMRNMSEVFADCQEFERKRLEFFKETLLEMHSILDISNDEKIPEIYQNLRSTVKLAEAHQDLRWWSQHNGEDMPMQWPKFIEFVPEMKESISKLKKSGSNLATDDGVKLRSINSSHGGSIRGSVMPSHAAVAAAAAANDSRDMSTPPDSTFGMSLRSDTNVDQEDALYDDGRPGVKVKALYDYHGAEDDELTFDKDEIFDKLDDEDEQGWCKGRRNGKIGLYPANYAEQI